MTALLDFDLSHGQTVIQMAADTTKVSELVEQLGSEEQRDLAAVLQEVHDLNMVAMVFLVGRDDLRNGAVREDGPAKRSRTALVDWAKSKSPATVTWTLAGMIATTSVSLLERFFRKAGPRFLGDARLDRLNPKGGRKFDGWLRELQSVGCVLDDSVTSVLRSLIAERNAFVHDHKPVLDRGYIDRAAIAMAAWPNAAGLCVQAFLRGMLARANLNT
jgi:hypothetical protein